MTARIMASRAIVSSVWFHRLSVNSCVNLVHVSDRLQVQKSNLSTIYSHNQHLTTLCLSNDGIGNRGRNEGNILLHKRSNLVTISVRGKKKKSSGSKRDEESDEESDEEDEEETDDLGIGGYDELTVVVPSLRIDNVLKAGTKYARAKIDEAFFQSRIRMNEQLITKKGELCTVNDVLDYIQGKHSDNEDMLTIDRVEVVSVPDIGLNTGKMKVKLRRYRGLQISNYPGNNAYDGAAVFIPFHAKDKNN